MDDRELEWLMSDLGISDLGIGICFLGFRISIFKFGGWSKGRFFI